MNSKTVFVTVGTTEFDTLIKEVSSARICQILKGRGYTNIILQIGRGSFEPVPCNINGFTMSFFRLKDSISDDIKNADLVVSHAGAGSVLETLEAGKKVVVVINEELMGNHQSELALAMAKQEYLFYSNIRNLPDVLQNSDFTQLKLYTKGNPTTFSHCLDSIMGFS